MGEFGNNLILELLLIQCATDSLDTSSIFYSLVDYIFKNIHTPVTHFCREKAATQRYSASFLRVNHYLDSFEAYSYRNDARPEKKCRKCYDDKAREASVQPDDDIRPWLKGFVDSVGREKAEILLAGAGKFT
mmetsp:Transcript_2942/g.4531  ORF Transcript_2942/g.4531 Transcript_2942/m.4531 type:complete len:132 (+) Transcript_2942:67-462(+)